MTNLRAILGSFKFQETKPNFDNMNKALESAQEYNEQKERQRSYRFWMPFIISIIVLILASLQVIHMYKSSHTKEKLLQQSNIINELSTKIIFLENQIKENELSLSKTNKMKEK